MNDKQHVQVPNQPYSEYKPTPQDLLIYVSIKRHMNSKTKEAFPSLALISRESGASIPTVRKCIENLKGHYFDIRTEGRKHIYVFNKKYKSFEPFSYEFLDNNNLTFIEKSYIVATQQYMFKDEEGFGKLTFNNSELGDKINMPESTIRKVNKSLTDKGLCVTIPTNKYNEETGLRINEKIYYLDELGQHIVWTLQNHEERISQTEKKTEENSRTLELALKRIEELERKLTGNLIVD